MFGVHTILLNCGLVHFPIVYVVGNVGRRKPPDKVDDKHYQKLCPCQDQSHVSSSKTLIQALAKSIKE